ncbi:MAG: hypothetical protein CME06_07585, partial [Gemmatimonadetes bacterium]|nr:hypothetical protein [Gemmatimonadota bacterium]
RLHRVVRRTLADRPIGASATRLALSKIPNALLLLPIAWLLFVQVFFFLRPDPDLYEVSRWLIGSKAAVLAGTYWIAAALLAVAAARAIPRLLRSGIASLFTALGVVTLFGGLIFAYLSPYTNPDPPAERGGGEDSAVRPNVLLLTLDTVRKANVSIYGYERQTTPFLQSLSEESVVFDRAYCVSSWTLPTHAALFTGMLPAESGGVSAARELRDDAPTLAGILREQGYATASITAGYALHRVFGASKGFDCYDDRLEAYLSRLSFARFSKTLQTRFRPPTSWDVARQRSAETVTGLGIEWLEKRGSPASPFFLHLNYFDAHVPYAPRDGFRHFSRDIPQPQGRNEPSRLWRHTKTDAAHERMLFDGRPVGQAPFLNDLIDLYDDEIRYMDHWIERLFEYLREAGILDNTIVVVTNDHGENMGEHDLLSHGKALFAPATDGILFIYDGRAPGTSRRIDTVVSQADVFPTIIEVVDVNGELESHYREKRRFRGSSLRPLLNGASGATSDAEHNDWWTNRAVFAQIFKNRGATETSQEDQWALTSLVRGRYKLLWTPDGKRRLFDLVSDPGETIDLGALGMAALADELALDLVEMESHMDVARQTSSPDEVAAKMRILKSLGYVQ